MEQIKSAIFIALFILLFLALPLGLSLTESFGMARTYNKIHKTNYNGWDFVFSKDIILNYQGQGRTSTLNLNVATEVK